ncbi:hypothetical protein [Streptomyces sp. 891-h]|uniref:hypothetical protein n=1 Tax=Streptomyces sp. 891-h TaxID=2720714 RepID=UPI001FAA8735|nr:hypothetical protein [Streptomyces sp. 891-h]UNZ20595.1 hypothetical protein HC362_29565 [Streptomyces sp. 891-h]
MTDAVIAAALRRIARAARRAQEAQQQDYVLMPPTTRRRARFRSIYVNGCPVWECGRCGLRRPPGTRETDLAEHEATCGQPAINQEQQ